MPRSLHNQLAYTGGELTPLMDARVDHPKYAIGCRQLQNMIALKQGGASRRPGFQFKARVKFYDSPGLIVRLMEFQFSPTTSFVLEMGNFYVRFYSNQEQVRLASAPTWVSGTTYQPGAFVEDPTAGDSIYFYTGAFPQVSVTPPSADFNWVQQDIYEVPTPYQSVDAYGSEVMKVTPCQINDVIYLVHPDFPVYKLERFADTDWRMSQVNFLTPALLDQNATGVFIGASGTTGSVMLSANAAAWVTATYYRVGMSVNPGGAVYTCIVAHLSGTFAADLANGYWSLETIFTNQNIGGYFQLGHLRDAAAIQIDITGNGTSAELEADGDCEFATYGTWAATVDLEESDDEGTTWYKLRTITSLNDHNSSIPVKVSGVARFRIVVSNYTADTGTPRAVFTRLASVSYGLVRITNVTNAYDATATVVERIASTNTTTLWSEGAWSVRRGYPKAITAFQQRVIYGGSSYEPQRIWGTVTNDFENFDRGDQAEATDSFAFDLAAVGRGRIQWLIGQVDLFVGFAGAEWIVNAGEGSFGGSSEPITPTQINAGEHSAWGSADGVPPELVGNSVLYTQRSARTIQQMAFSVYTNKYMSADMTGLSDHLFRAGIVQFAYQPQFRDQGIVWVVTKAGSLCGMTYDLQSEVYAWHRHITGYSPVDESLHAIESVACINGVEQEDDQVWVVVNRANGRTIELMDPLNWESSGPDVKGIAQPDPKLAYYVDSGVTEIDPVDNVIDGLGHLEGMEVIGLLNGNIPLGAMTVSGGSVTIENYEPAAGDVVHIGLATPYAVQGMRMDVDGRAGLVAAIMKAISRGYVRLINSLGGKVVGNGEKQVPIEYRKATSPLGTVGTIFTGEKEVVPEGTQSVDPVFIVQGNDALPVTVLATTLRVGITGGP